MAKLNPIIKWAGGKRQLLDEIKKSFPENFNNFFEPFVGGGALFLNMQHPLTQISDMNYKLINLYLQVKNQPKKLIVLLDKHEKNHSEKYYYICRNIFSANKCSKLELAALFIYLNKAGFNGLYRENSKGEFNVPWGKRENISLYDASNILELSKYLKTITIIQSDYKSALIHVKKGDLVYFDPPYHPVTKTSFTKYQKNDFTEANQIELFNLCEELTKKGVHWVLSNSNSDFIKQLYQKYNIKILSLSRSINSNANGRKKEANEIIIDNLNFLQNI